MDHNRDIDLPDFPKRAGIEFRTAPVFLNKRDESANIDEFLFIIGHMDKWITESAMKFQNIPDHKKCSERQKEKASKQKIYLKLEDWVDLYNKERPSEYTEMLLTELNENEEWYLELEMRDIGHPISYYTQINATIPTKDLNSPEVRELFPHSTETLLGEKEPDSLDFHVLRDHKNYLDYENQIYEKSLNLADEFFRNELEGKIFKDDNNEKPRKLNKVKAFLRTMVYETAMVSTTTQKLQELFSTQSSIATSNLVDTLGKDTFPYGLKKFTLRTFFNELLTDNDRNAVLGLGKEKIIDLCKDAKALAEVGKGRDEDSYLLRRQGQRELDVDKLYNFTFTNNQAEETDPMLLVMQRFIPTSPLGYNKDKTRIKKTGVVEFRAPESGNHQINDTIRRIRKYIEIYSGYSNNVNQKEVHARQACVSNKRRKGTWGQTIHNNRTDNGKGFIN